MFCINCKTTVSSIEDVIHINEGEFFYPYANAGKLLVEKKDFLQLPEWKSIQLSKVDFLGLQGSYSLMSGKQTEEFLLDPEVLTPLGPVTLGIVNDSGEISVTNLPIFENRLFIARNVREVDFLSSFVQETIYGDSPPLYTRYPSPFDISQELAAGSPINLNPDIDTNSFGVKRQIVLPFDIDKLAEIRVRFIAKQLVPLRVRQAFRKQLYI